MKVIRLSSKEKSKGTLASLVERQQKVDLKRFKEEQKRKEQAQKPKRKKKKGYGYILGTPIKKRKQTKTLSRKRRIGL